MPHTLNLAAVRMDATPISVESRLNRAWSLISRASKEGTQLVVLPELFNTGYVYSLQNYQLAEEIDGNTVSWMKSTAHELNIYIAGSLLLRESDGIFNAMLLVSPDEQIWRYDKSYPWAWERAYFRPRKNSIQVAETGLGKIGMLICWDVGHANLWAQYAGKIDLFISSSCPPLVHKLDIHLPDGKVVNSKELGKLLQFAYRGADQIFGELYLNQTRWLGVPSVNTTGAGTFKSQLPLPKLAASSFFTSRPDLWKYIGQAEKITISASYFDDTFIANADGNLLAKTKIDDDDLVIAPVRIADEPPQPKSLKQPDSGLGMLTYLVDKYINAILKNYYDQRWRNTT